MRKVRTMLTVRYVAYRYLSNAEFFNIYKPSGTEEHGGGQVYTDFPTQSISLASWQRFFRRAPGVVRSRRAEGRPAWTLTLHSIGTTAARAITMYQRRPQSVCIASQRITSARENRVDAWRPENGFPQPASPTSRHSLPRGLAVFIARTDNGTFWAGWFCGWAPCKDRNSTAQLTGMLSTRAEGSAGLIALRGDELMLDVNDRRRPFCARGASSGRGTPGKRVRPRKHSKYTRKRRKDKDLIRALFDEDEDYSARAEVVARAQMIRKRNTRAVKNLKELYGSRCQLTGKQFTFKRADGALYSEAHHLIPLGERGADSPYNIIIVSPLIHRMLHYANVSKIDLSRISKKNTLAISINRKRYTISWHPEHARSVRSQR